MNCYPWSLKTPTVSIHNKNGTLIWIRDADAELELSYPSLKTDQSSPTELSVPMEAFSIPTGQYGGPSPPVAAEHLKWG